MNSERFQLQNSLEANYLCVELEAASELDNIAMRVLKEDCPEFLIPYQVKTVNDKIILKYKLINTVALEYSSKHLPKAVFVEMFKNLLKPFIEGNNWFLDYHNFCIDSRYVYLARNSGEIYYIYVPDASFKNTDEEILKFFKKVFTDIEITDDKDLQIKLYRYFESGNVTLSGLYKILSEETVHENKINLEVNNADAKKHLKAENSAKENENGNKDKASVIVENKQSDDNDNIMDALFGVDGSKKKKEAKVKKEKPTKEKTVKEKRSFTSALFKKKKKDEFVIDENIAGSGASEEHKIPQNDEGKFFEYTQVGNVSYTEETEIYEEASSTGSYMELIYSEMLGAPVRIELNFSKQFIILGRISNDEEKPDVAFPREFKHIGRRHARIERSSNEYYLIDLGSVNHTFLNGQMLVPNQLYKLCNGMEICFTERNPIRYRIHI